MKRASFISGLNDGKMGNMEERYDRASVGQVEARRLARNRNHMVAELANHNRVMLQYNNALAMRRRVAQRRHNIGFVVAPPVPPHVAADVGVLDFDPFEPYDSIRSFNARYFANRDI